MAKTLQETIVVELTNKGKKLERQIIIDELSSLTSHRDILQKEIGDYKKKVEGIIDLRQQQEDEKQKLVVAKNELDAFLVEVSNTQIGLNKELLKIKNDTKEWEERLLSIKREFEVVSEKRDLLNYDIRFIEGKKKKSETNFFVLNKEVIDLRRTKTEKQKEIMVVSKEIEEKNTYLFNVITGIKEKQIELGELSASFVALEADKKKLLSDIIKRKEDIEAKEKKMLNEISDWNNKQKSQREDLIIRFSDLTKREEIMDRKRKEILSYRKKLEVFFNRPMTEEIII